MYDAPVTFKEAMEDIDRRMDAPTAKSYKEIMEQWAPSIRRRSFFTARCYSATMLSALHRKVQQIIGGEMTEKEAVRKVREFLKDGGEGELVRMGFLPAREAKGISQLASIPRLNLIFHTNATMAKERGRYLQWKAVKDFYPYGMWHCGYAEKHREEHLAREGKIYPFDHPIWRQSPPGGEFNCHCWRELITKEDAEERGLAPEPMDSPFQPSSLGFDPSTPLEEEVTPGKSVLPQYAEKIHAEDPPEDFLPEMDCAPQVTGENTGNSEADNTPGGEKEYKAQVAMYRPVAGEVSRKKTQELLDPILEQGAKDIPDEKKKPNAKDGENILPEFDNGTVRSSIAKTILKESDFLKSKGFPTIRAVIKHPRKGNLAAMSQDNVLFLNEDKLRDDLQNIKEKKNASVGRDFFTGSDRLINTTLHEFGHLVYNTIRGRDSERCQEAIHSIKAWYDSDASTGDTICGWENEREWFAENYAFWRMNRTDLLSKANGNALMGILNHLKEFK